MYEWTINFLWFVLIQHEEPNEACLDQPVSFEHHNFCHFAGVLFTMIKSNSLILFVSSGFQENLCLSHVLCLKFIEISLQSVDEMPVT
jgi:hypothetical protein